MSIQLQHEHMVQKEFSRGYEIAAQYRRTAFPFAQDLDIHRHMALDAEDYSLSFSSGEYRHTLRYEGWDEEHDCPHYRLTEWIKAEDGGDDYLAGSRDFLNMGEAVSAALAVHFRSKIHALWDERLQRMAATD